MILEINGQVVDLPTNAAGLVKLQKSLAALSDLDTRTGEYSWSLTLPPTRRNAGIFGVALLHPQGLDKFAGSFVFRLRSGGEEWRGSFLLSSIRRGYTGSLSMDSFSWARALGEKTLNELTTLRSLAYDGNQLVDVLAMDCDQTDLQFPLVAYGNYYSPPSVEVQADGTEQENPTPAGAGLGPEPLAVDDYPPSVYYLSVLRAIFREAGYFVQGPVLQSEELRTWCITAAGSAGDFWPWGSILPGRAESTTSQTLYSYHGEGPGGGYANNAAGFDEATQVFYLLPRTPVFSGGGSRAGKSGKAEFLAPIEGVYDFAWLARLSSATQTVRIGSSGSAYIPYFAPVGLGLVVFRAGAGYEGADGGLCSQTDSSLNTISMPAGQDRVVDFVRLDQPGTYALPTGTFSGEATGLYLEAGDTVRVLAFARRRVDDVNGGDPLAQRRRFELVFAEVALECTAFDGPTLLEPAKVLPPLRQADVVKDFLLKTNTVPVVDQDRRTITLLSREAHTQAQGEPIELDDCCDPAGLEFLPVLDGVGSVVFRPAEDASDAVAGPDVVRISLPGTRAAAEKTLTSCFAATGGRYYYVLQPGAGYTVAALLPCVASQAQLDTPRSDVNGPDLSGASPRVVRYLGADETVQIPFLIGGVPLARADYGGALAWGGDAGAVATGYRAFLGEAARGQVARVPAGLTPGQYAALSPGRRVWLRAAEYSVEKIEGWDPENPASASTLTLLRRV